MKVHPYLSTEKVLQAIDVEMPCGRILTRVEPIPLTDFTGLGSSLIYCRQCSSVVRDELARMRMNNPQVKFYLYGLASGQDVRDAA